VRVGDVFKVPLDDQRVGLGQIVATYGKDAYFFALFEPAFARDEELDLEKAVREPVAFLALSFDAKVAGGDWVVVGNQSVAPGMPLARLQGDGRRTPAGGRGRLLRTAPAPRTWRRGSVAAEPHVRGAGSLGEGAESEAWPRAVE